MHKHSAPGESGEAADHSGRGGGEGSGAGSGQDTWAGAAGPAQSAALTRGPGGVARRYGSSRPAAAAAATAAAKAGTHHAAALMAGPERAAWLGAGRSRRAGGRELAAEHTPEPRTLPGEHSSATPGSEPARSAAPRLRSSGCSRGSWRRRRAWEALSGTR